MKKRISLIISALLTWSALSISVYADDIIIGAGDMTYADGGTAVTATGYSATAWGDGTNGSMGVNYSANSDLKAEYANLPTGMYRVLYYLPKNSQDYATGRSARILDTDVHIKDKNGTVDILSVKDYIYDSGYKDLGVYEFDGVSNSISVTVNADNKIVKGQWDAIFAFNHIKLEPVTDDHTELLAAVNNATSASDIEQAVEALIDEFVDKDALFDMSGVYESLYAARPDGGWTSSYHFQRGFNKCVEDKLTAVKIPSSSFVWQTSEANTQTDGWRINWNPIELVHTENKNVAVATFKFTNTEHIKRLNLKLNHDKSSNIVQNSVVITKYSGDVYNNPSSEKVQNSTMNSVVFTDLINVKKMMFSSKDIKDAGLLGAIEKNGYLSLYMRGDYVSYQDGNCGQLKLSTDAEITAYYDLTYLGGEADLNYYGSDGAVLDADSVPITNTSIKIKHANGKEFKSLDFLDYITVQADGSDMAKDDYTVERVDNATISVSLKNGFKYDTKYTVTSDRYVNFEGDGLSYEFAAKFVTEKYPAEFSGIQLKSDGHTITSLDGIKGKKVHVEAEIKNNSLPEFGAYLVVNLYEQTENGIKMTDSKAVYGKVGKDNPLKLTETFEIPNVDADRFVAAFIWDGFKTMNFIKMYNMDSYQRID